MNDISIVTVARRIDEVRNFCRSQIAHDRNPDQPFVVTNRAWCAQAVLNILDGNVDGQFHAR